MKSASARNDSPSTRFGRYALVALTALLAIIVFSSAALAVTTVWKRTVNGSANSYDAGEALAIAPNGAIYTVGILEETGEDQNIWIRKYDSSGTKLWTRTVNGPSDSWDNALGTAVDTSGNLYVVGFIRTSTEGTNIWIRKYSPAGAKLWTRVVDGPASDGDAAYDVAVDSSNNLYVVGYSHTATQGRNIWIRKYANSGSKLWTRSVNGPANAADLAGGVAVDSADNVYVVGHVFTPGDSYDIWIRKYSPSGSKLWTRTVNGGAGGSDNANGAAVDSNGNLIVVGTVSNVATGQDIWIRKFSPTGSKRWTRTVKGPGTARDIGLAVALDTNNGVFVTGLKTVSGGSEVAWTAKYSSSGTKRWTTTYAGSDGEADGRGIAVNATGRVYVTGGVVKAGQSTNIWIRKYKQ